MPQFDYLLLESPEFRWPTDSLFNFLSEPVFSGHSTSSFHGDDGSITRSAASQLLLIVILGLLKSDESLAISRGKTNSRLDFPSSSNDDTNTNLWSNFNGTNDDLLSSSIRGDAGILYGDRFSRSVFPIFPIAILAENPLFSSRNGYLALTGSLTSESSISIHRTSLHRSSEILSLCFSRSSHP
nr:hypothetical protein Iba_chr11dCG2210 [Ipomoea batatas]